MGTNWVVLLLLLLFWKIETAVGQLNICTTKKQPQPTPTHPPPAPRFFPRTLLSCLGVHIYIVNEVPFLSFM